MQMHVHMCVYMCVEVQREADIQSSPVALQSIH